MSIDLKNEHYCKNSIDFSKKIYINNHNINTNFAYVNSIKDSQ